MKAKTLAVIGRLHRDESGQDLIEYALLGLLIATAAVAAMSTLAITLNTTYTSIETAVAAAAGG